ncbi:DNA-J protein, putative [Bodo saltans]|uniref:DNA-J protein, putative n=1 Tax=Bodo saltans TaxID=75058 RepID=A0A0S4J203_BODSA|nr:DNA-J protein, putative [Bodo saltans]|eukprot:CUG36896.1 DNA-J protein, putative [Bodo saltans]
MLWLLAFDFEVLFLFVCAVFCEPEGCVSAQRNRKRILCELPSSSVRKVNSKIIIFPPNKQSYHQVCPLPHMLDYYAALGLTPLASASDVRASFKKLALQLHPDRQHSKPPLPLAVVGATCRGATGRGHPSAATQASPFTFAEIKEAYEVLSDDMKRMLYDAERQDLFPSPDYTSGEVDQTTMTTNHGGLPSDLEEWFRRNESEQQAQQHQRAPPSTPHSMPYISASTLLAMDKRQLPEESHVKWGELFEQRRGVIGRRPLSRLSSSGGGRRPPLPTPDQHAATPKPQPVSNGDAPTSTPSPGTTLTRPVSNRLEILRRARPSSGMGPMLTDMHLRRDQLYHPQAETSGQMDASVPLPGPSRPPLHSQSASAGPTSRPPPGPSNAASANSDNSVFSLPQFRPASCTPTATSPKARTVPPSPATPQPGEHLKTHPRALMKGGMSATRREVLGIGHGAATRPNSSQDTQRSSASDRTMKLFFS